MNRTSSVSLTLFEKELHVNVSASHELVENCHDNVQLLSRIDDGQVSFRIKPDRRSSDAVMPAGSERRRYC